MSLVKCPECNKRISDQAKACPNCGYPVNQIDETSVQLKKEDNRKLFTINVYTSQDQAWDPTIFAKVFAENEEEAKKVLISKLKTEDVKDTDKYEFRIKESTSIIKCPKCNKENLYKLDSCPKCNFSIRDLLKEKIIEFKKRDKKSEDITKSLPAKEPEVGGWLTLFCVILILFIPISLISEIVITYKEFGYFNILILILVFWNVFMCIFSIYTGISLFNVRPNSINIAKKFLLLLLVKPILLILLFVVARDPKTLEDIKNSLIKRVVFVLIWFDYLVRSKRVKELRSIIEK